MSFKEFLDWCNQRACDGCWGLGTATLCIDIVRTVKNQPFWKRKKVWEELYKECGVGELVDAINKRIAEVYGND